MPMTSVYLLALAANLCFSTASLVFSHFSKRYSPFWMNQFKVVVAVIAFAVIVALSGPLTPISPMAILFLLLSGFVGLCIGDVFLFRAYTTLGPGRSLVLFSFQPLILGFYAWVILGQGMSSHQLLAVACMVLCLATFVWERNKLIGHWDLKSFGWALLGIFLDAVGVMLTRSSYELTPDLSAHQLNLIRATGALIGFIIWRPRSYIGVARDWMAMTYKDRGVLLSACLAGTVLSLTLYLTALKYAHLASLTAVAITGPIWVSLLECLWYRRWPNRYLLGAFAFFIIGFYLIQLG